MINILKKLANKFLKYKTWQKAVTVLSGIVVFATVYMLVLPALTMEKKDALICGMEEHIHIDECYQERTELVCGLDEDESHTHSDECYETVTELICGMDEHTHTDECYAYSEEETEAETAVCEEETEAESESASYEEETYIEQSTAFDETVIPGLDGIAVEGFVVMEETEDSAEETTEAVAFDDDSDEDYDDRLVDLVISAVADSVSIANSAPAPLTYTDENGTVYTLKVLSSGVYILAVNCGESSTDDTASIITIALPDEWSGYKNSIFSIEISGGSENVDVKIADNAFKDCVFLEYLTVSDFKSNYLYIGSYAFSGCTGLRNVTFNEPETYHLNIGEYGFNGCTALRSFVFPLFGGFKQYAFANCTALSSLTFTETPAGDGELKSIGADNPFRNDSALKTLDLTPLKNITSVGSSYFLNVSGVSTIKLPNNVTTLAEGAWGATKLNNLILEDEGSIKTIGTWVLRETAFTKVDLSAYIGLKSLSGTFDSSSALKEATLAPNITYLGGSLFRACVNFKMLNLNTVSLEGCEGIFNERGSVNGPTEVTINICKNVDYISNTLFTKNKGHIGALTFEGENEFTISGSGVATGIPAPLDVLGGNYYASAEGDLYQLFETTEGVKTATLIYKANVSDGNTVFTLPEKVGVNKDYTVTAIGDSAVKDSGITEFSFENVSSITDISENSFTNCPSLSKLQSISNLDNVVEYFKSKGFDAVTDDYFYNTALSPIKEAEKTVYPIDGGTAASRIATSSNEFQIVSSAEDKNLYTGQIEKVSIHLSNEGIGSVLRLYFMCDDSCSFDTYDYNKVQIAGVDVILRHIENTDIYYYEIGPVSQEALADSEGSTSTIAFEFVYPNLTADNSNLKLWAAVGNTEQFAAYDESNPNIPIMPANKVTTEEGDVQQTTSEGIVICDTYFDVTWKTQNYIYPVEKTRALTTPYLYLTPDGLAAVKDLAYVIKLKNAEAPVVIEGNANSGVLGSKPDYGSDLVKYADFDDVLTLPSGLYWREGILDAVREGNYIYSDGALTVNCDNNTDYTLFTISNASTAISNVSVYVTNEDCLGIKWRYSNLNISNSDASKITDISDCNVTVTYGDNVILYDEKAWNNVTETTTIEAESETETTTEALDAPVVTETESEIEITTEAPQEETTLISSDELTETIDHYTNNRVTCTENYQYADPETTEASCGGELTVSETGGFSLTKSKSYPNSIGTTYFGEELYYTIKAKNSSALSNKSVDHITDSLQSNYMYITADNMQIMFDELKADPSCNLNITIGGIYNNDPKMFFVGMASTLSKADIQTMANDTTVSGSAIEVKAIDGSDAVITSSQYYYPTASLHYNEDIMNSKVTPNNYIQENQAIKIHYLKAVLETDTENRERVRLTIYNAGSTGTGTDIIAQVYIGQGADCRFSTIKQAFESLGIVVLSWSKYDVTYYYPNGFAPGEEKTHIVRSTIKDSFVMLYNNNRYNYQYPTRSFAYSFAPGANTAIAYTADGTKYASSNSVEGGGINSRASSEIKIAKTVSAADKDLKTTGITDGDVLDYNVAVYHRGTGTFDVLPVTDGMNGIQAMLVEYDANCDESWTSDLSEDHIYTHSDGTKYYILLPPKGENNYLFKGVNINGHYADSVEVTVTRNDNGVITDIHTVTKWFLADTLAGSFNLDIKYKALFDVSAFCKIFEADPMNIADEFKAKNFAFLGDRQTSLYYDYVEMGVGSFDVDKAFVKTEADNDPEKDDVYYNDNKLSYDGYHNVKINYRLTLENTDNVTRTASGKVFYDSLPLNTVGSEDYSFEWKPENIELHYAYGNEGAVATYNGEVVGRTAENGSAPENPADDRVYGDTGEWYISYNCPEETTDIMAYQQYLCWDENFKVTLAPKEKFYIYVTLTLPMSDSQQWTDYVRANAGRYLENTFHWKAENATVRSSLLENGRAFIEKGVYDTSFVSTYLSGITSGCFKRGNKNEYVSGVTADSGCQGTVVYYVVLRNSGSNKLYIYDLYDDLPKGFKFYGLVSQDGTGDIFGYGSGGNSAGGNKLKGIDSVYYEGTYSYSTFRPLASVSADDVAGKNEIKTRKTADTAIKIRVSNTETIGKGTSDEHTRLTFQLYGGVLDDADHNDGHGRYLNSGEYVVFAYQALTGTDSTNEVNATNTIAMRYEDDTFFEEDPDNWQTPSLDNDTVAKSTNTRGAENNGKRYIKTDADVAEFDYFAEDSTETTTAETASETTAVDTSGKSSNSTYWLTSDVTVTRGAGENSAPDILKTVYDDNKSNYVTNTYIKKDEIVKWRITEYNRGSGYISNFHLVDKLDDHQRFIGKFSMQYKTDLKRTHSSGAIYTACENNGYVSRAELFTINERNGKDEDYIAIVDSKGETYYIDLSSGNECTVLDSQITEIKNTPVSCCGRLYNDYNNSSNPAYIPITVSVKNQIIDGDTKEILDIGFEDESWGIMPDCYVALDFSTQNITGIYNSNPSLYNTATIMPVNKTYDSSKIQTGYNEAGVGVSSYAFISSDVNYPTTSHLQISVTDSNGKVHSAESTDINNIVVIDNENQPLRYTLTVENAEDIAMNQIVLIDNLPFEGDSNTIKSTVDRLSQFRVKLANDPSFEVSITERDTEGNITGSYSLKAGDYKIQYSTTKSSDFNKQTDFAGVETNDWHDWNSNLSEETINSICSLRLILKPLKDDGSLAAISPNAVISFAFTALLDMGNAESIDAFAGDIAYNTFGYQYTYTEGGATTALYAAPRKVGVSVAANPYLQKTIINSRGGDINAKVDRDFTFVIYDGSIIDFQDEYQKTVGEALMSNGRNFTVVTLRVPRGETISQNMELSDLVKYTYSAETGFIEALNGENTIPWEWGYDYNDNTITARSYNIVEITDDSTPYDFSYVSGYADEQNYTFSYDPTKNLSIGFANMRKDWNIKLHKTDIYDGFDLKDAVFAIYSSNAEDAITEAKLNGFIAQYGINDYSQSELKTEIMYSSELDNKDKTYYLSDILKTDAGGFLTFSDLYADDYVVAEIQAPGGYYIEKSQGVYYFSFPYETGSETNWTVEQELSNPRTIKLPETGGTGMKLIYTVSAGILAFGVFMLLKRKKFKA